MSVQVRRRREAASFLSTYVGAGGELLVDTTNNRVQVHDGVTPGGWPAARLVDLPGRNVIINGTFAVNQRAYATGATLAAGAYGHDRWKAGSGGGAYTFTQGVPDTLATITSGSMLQVIEGSNVAASSVLLSWIGTATARAYQGAAASQTSPAYAGGSKFTTAADGAKNYLLVTGLTVGTNLNVEFSGGTFGLVQVESAKALPSDFERRQLATDLMYCQRYYFQATGPAAAILQINAYCQAGQYLVNTIALPATMRATPTMGLIGTYALVNTSAANIQAGSPNMYIAYCQATGTASTGFYNSTNGGFYASAEL